MGLDPSAIFKLATAYWGSCVFLTANRINLFSIIGQSEMTATEIADALNAKPRPLEMFLNACAALGLLEKKNMRYKNTAVAGAFLVKGTPAYLGDALKYSDDLYQVWGKLEDTLRSGEPALKPQTILGEDPRKTRNFILGMHNRALGVGKSLADSIDLSGRKSLLDVGGGPATYSVLLAQKTAGLASTVMDLPKVVEIAEEIIREFNMGDRVRAIAGDYTKDVYPQGHDCILNSGIFHRETEESCRKLLKKAFDALENGGCMIVNDVFCNTEKDGPPFVMLFGVNMLLTSQFGTVHSTDEVSRWMTEAGFIDVSSEPLPPPMPHTVIKAIKP